MIFSVLVCLALLAGGLAAGQTVIAVAGFLAMVAVAAAVLFNRRKSKRPLRSAPEPGPKSHSKVADALMKDPQNLMVLHRIPTQHGELDHVVVRRNGALVVIDTEWSPGRVGEAQGRLLLNGRPFDKDVADKARRNAMWLKDELRRQLGLRVFVHACVVFANAYVTIRRPVRGVEAVNFSYLPRFLARLPADRRLQDTIQRAPDRIRETLVRSQREVTRAA